MYLHTVYVLHSPYPDGTWRGLEKCAGHEHGPLTFLTREDAESFMNRDPDLQEFYRIVELTLVTPSVRKPLDSTTYDRVMDRLSDDISG